MRYIIFIFSIVWIIFVIPTLTVAFDFVMITLMDKELLIDHIHYIATLLWVLAVCASLVCRSMFIYHQVILMLLEYLVGLR